VGVGQSDGVVAGVVVGVVVGLGWCRVGGSPCRSQAMPSPSWSSSGAYIGSPFGIMLTPAAFASSQVANFSGGDVGVLVALADAVGDAGEVVVSAALAGVVGAAAASTPRLSGEATRSDDGAGVTVARAVAVGGGAAEVPAGAAAAAAVRLAGVEGAVEGPAALSSVAVPDGGAADS
jgi:hypothetical protein